MFQQFIALAVIIFFIARLFFQKKKYEVSSSEFVFWLVFWVLAGLAAIFIRSIDRFVSNLGFSATGANVLFYGAVVILFYLIFRLRLRLEKLERNLTKLVRDKAIKDENNR